MNQNSYMKVDVSDLAMKIEQTEIRKKFLPALAMILLVLLAALSFSIYRMGNERVTNEYRKSVSRLETLLRREVDADAGNFDGLADLIRTDTTIQRACQSGDRVRLLTAATPIFDQICAPKSITHFYFHRPDKTCFLRVHKPDRFDDVIGRYTLKIAAETGQPASGLELGSLGTLTLRRVYPWRVDGKLIGYLELGEDIHTINQRLSERLGIDIVAGIDKTFLDRDAWQEGMKMVGQTCGQWSDCDRHVIGDSTLDTIPAEFRAYMHTVDSQTQQTETVTRLMVSQRTHLASCLPITDASGVVVGTWTTFCDVSGAMAAVSRSVMMTIIITAIVGQCLYVFSFFFLERIERHLKETDRKQREEIANRRFAEAQLTEAKGRADTALTDLRQVQEKLQLHIDLMPLGVIQWDPNLRVESWNPAAEKIFGFTAEEAMGRLANELMVPEDVYAQVEDIRQKLLSQTGGTNERNENVTQDGHRISCHWHNTPLVNSNGRVVGISSIIQDVTRELEYEQRLQDAKEWAEAASETKSIFMANMTHELRTPMNAILGFSDLLREEALTGEQLDYVETIHASGQHLLSLINDVLDISKIEAGKLEIVNDCCLIRPLLKQVQSMMQAAAAESRLNLEVIAAESLPVEIITDAKRLHQCLINLLGNAIKFTDEQGTVSLRAGLLDDDANPWLYFEVKDTGIGIPADRLDKIFESFEQADIDTSVKYGGTGLGLSITRQLVEKMGGALTVESEEGVGSTFTITLPLEPVPQPVA